MKVFFTVKKKFKDLNIKKDVWLSNTYYQHIKKKFKKKTNHNFFFSLLNFLIYFLKNKDIITLDYGGGAGEYFYKHYFDIKKNNKIIIFDNSKMINLGKKKITYKNIKFIDDLNLIKYKKINILLFSSVSQYIENINEKIKNLFYLKPDFIIFEDFFATSFKPFVTYQKFFEYKIPVKFHNIKMLENFMKKNKYKLIYKTAYLPLIKGEFKFYDMLNLPKKNRVKNTFNLVFKKI